jgi:hypothetical protein
MLLQMDEPAVKSDGAGGSSNDDETKVTRHRDKAKARRQNFLNPAYNVCDQ